MRIRHLIAATLALVAVLWFQGARADALDDLLTEGVVKLYHDYRAGHLQDLSGNGNHGTGTDIVWPGDGVRFNAATSVITVADAAELQLTAGMLLVFGNFQQPSSWRMLIHKRDAGGTNYSFYIDTVSIRLNDGVNIRQVVTSVDGAKCIALNMTNGGTAEAFVDGISVGLLNAASSISVDDAPLLIGAYHVGGVPQLDSTLAATLIVNRELTDTEMAQTCAALQSYRYPTMPRAVAQGSYGAEEVADWDMEAVGVADWNVGAGATLTKTSGRALAGDLVLNVAYNATPDPYAYQVMLTPGTTYRFTAGARGDATFLPYVQDAATLIWTGTVATSWQYVDFVFTAVGTDLRLYSNANAAGFCEYDNISIKEVESPYIQYKTEWGAKVLGNVGGNENLPGTDLWVNSGNMGITVQEINATPVKAVTCAAGGGFQVQALEFKGDSFQDAYGTFEFWFRKAAGTTFIAHFIADDLAGTNGYSFRVSATEVVTLVHNGAGNLFATTAAYVTADTWYQVRITRKQADGMFTAYLDGVLVTADSGANPVAENTVKASTYIVFDVGTGDHVGISDLAGNYSLWKGHGVISP